MYSELKKRLDSQSVTLVAVSKTKPHGAILDLYNQGQKIFGENRVQELAEKHEALPKDIQWHMIGHLQKNKVKYIAPFVSLIHSVDNLALAKTINKEAKKNERVISILLQIKIGVEEAKTGYAYEQLIEDLSELITLKHIKICGLMGIGTFTTDTAVTTLEFSRLHSYFKLLQLESFKDQPDFKEVSMGMSGDYPLAIEHGSTMVRIGSLLFGSRK